MAIDLTGLSSTPSTNTRSNKLDSAGQSQAGKSQQSTTGGTSGSGTVTLSSEAQALHKLEEQVGQLPDVNSERVEALKKAIEEGSYGVDAERLAAKIVDFEEQTFG